jgi:hypothetical protein
MAPVGDGQSERESALPRWIARAVVLSAALFLAFGAGGGPGWTPASTHSVIAVQLQQIAAAPLYGLVSTVASCLPFGEIGFRLAVANGLLGALAVAGVLRAARALLPKDPIAGVAGAVVLVVTPPFREAAGTAGPAMLATAGAVWAVAFALEHARAPSARTALASLASSAVVAGASPWLGVFLGALLGAWLWRASSVKKSARKVRERSQRAVIAGAGTAGALAILWWWRALGEVPVPFAGDASNFLTVTGHGAAAAVLGAGLLGAAFGAATGLRAARWLAAAIAVAAVASLHDPVPVLALLAIPIAVIPSALARVLPTTDRALIAVAAGLPLVGGAVVAGAAFTVDDPGDAPARLATDLVAYVPPGPGVFVSTRITTWSAITYAQTVAGVRPDLELVPLEPVGTDELVVNAMRRGSVAASDVASFGQLKANLAVPRRRGFQLLIDDPKAAPRRAEPPARYASAIGERESILLALARARHEAVAGRLDNAARALGLDNKRFDSADLAIMASTNPVHPAMYGFIPPLDGGPPGPWMLELLGDDLAWVAGIELDKPAAEAPAERRLHALWRALLLGKIRRQDPALVALGPVASAATDAMLAALAEPVAEPKAPPPAPPTIPTSPPP